ncbi:MAG: UDP-N-acetylglucosamine--N-acetylmuramyl-(pentapeptide) pyrophosphoryl-undecaprenol N-acetylglucosamine transferase [Candidatus Limnocylindrales bacterium]
MVMRVLVAGGGTGGHIFPALAALRELRRRQPDLEVRWLGGHRGIEAEVVPAAGYRLDRLALRTLRSVDLSVATVTDPLRLAVSAPQAAAHMLRWRPDVLYTTGGYVAIPTLAAAFLLRVPSLMWEGNRLAGRSVRATARLASALAVSYAGTQDELPGRPYLTGTPIRAVEGMDPSVARERLGIADGLPVLLVFGGSQAVRRFNSGVALALPRLVERCCVIHVTGDAGIEEAREVREHLPEALRDRYRPAAFLGDEMTAALVAADLLVGRAGSSTMAEASALGLPVVVVPYPHAAGHQRANAQELVGAGGALLVPDEELDADRLVEVAGLLDDPSALDAMRAGARSVGRPGAAMVTADLLEALATRSPLPSREAIQAGSRAAA